MRYLVFSDVHNYYDQLTRALSAANYDPASDILISCGDLLDRGPKPTQCLEFVASKIKENKIICVRGNHEDLLETALGRLGFLSHDISNGTAATVFDTYESSPSRIIPASTLDAFDYFKNYEPYKIYASALRDYYELDSFVFVHGWIPTLASPVPYANGSKYAYTLDLDDHGTPNWRAGDWSSARWVNGMDAWRQGAKLSGKTIVCGHWHSSWGHHYISKSSVEFPNKRSTNPDDHYADFTTFHAPGIEAIDACTAFSHTMNLLVIEKEYGSPAGEARVVSRISV